MPGARAHHRQRLVRPVLAVAQRADRRSLAGVASQVITADPFDRDNASGSQSGDRSGQRHCAVGRLSVAVAQFQSRSAGGAGHRLGMKPAVEGLFIFALARFTEAKVRHGGLCPVIGHAADQRIAWPALCAVDERVAKAPVSRVGELRQAFVAGKIIRRHRNARLGRLFARQDFKRR
jgi:hypothetical protein